ncbi:phage tail protein [Undibacterium sp. Di24W]|uniref:phage tail protein n=1 Tax=Undibacterium sp. Di24W TaxID=3413033 RepID=UPI003BF0EC5A
MSVSLPNGIVLALATAYAANLTVTAASNASEAVLTVTNTLANGDYFEFVSGWSRANNRVFRAKSVSGTNLVAEGLDTSSTTLFPVGSGLGTIRKINTWTQITQIMGCTSSGGEPQYQTYSFLEQDFDSQIPTTTSAQSLALEIADDPTLAGYQALKTVAQTRAVTALRATLPAGGFILYNGIFAFDETPSLTKGNLMSVKSGVALQGRPVRYAT